MKVKALRGVCIGVDRHLVAGDSADLEPAMVTFLVGIRAVERVVDEPPKREPPVESLAESTDPKTETVPSKAGKKEK
jgi:hypothetical protein